MGIGLAFGVYFVAIFLGGALLAPWLYFGVQLGGEHWPVMERLAEHPFHRFVHRSVMLVGLAGLWPLLRVIRMRSGAQLGLSREVPVGGPLGRGFLLGFVSLAVVAMAALVWGAREWREDLALAALGRRLMGAGISAGLVALMEELFFRGVLFGGLRRRMGWVRALAISSGVYALLHFFQRPPPPEAVYWWTGLSSLGLMLRGFVELEVLVPRFFTLLVAGGILGWAYQRTGALYLSMGLHAGWIFWLKACNYISRPGQGYTWFFGGNDLVDGWLALGAMILLWVTLVKFSGGVLIEPGGAREGAGSSRAAVRVD